MRVRGVNIQRHPWISGESMAVIHSDGISAKLDLKGCLPEERPERIAHYIMNEYWRKNDDGTVVVVK